MTAQENWQDTVYGRFPTYYEVDTLKNLCDPRDGIQTGPFGSLLHKEDYVEIGTPIITVEHLGENRIIHRNLPKVSDEDRERLAKFAIYEGDIVFSRVGSVDRRALVRTEENGWLFSGRCLRIRPNRSIIDPGYLSYFFGLPRFKYYIRSIAVGATMPSLNTTILSDIYIYYPPLPEQRAIARILGALDDKIELNRRQSATLEAIARALFKAWFVDFEPVRAKMNPPSPSGRGAGGEGPADLYDLFPDRLVDSELGPIPEGWRVSTVGAEIKVVGGGTPSTKEPAFWENGSHLFATPKDLSTLSSPVLLSTERKVTDAGLEKISSGLLPAGTVLMSSRAPVGYLAMTYVPVCINQGFIAMLCEKDISNFYAFFWANANMAHIKQRASGTTFAEISKRNFRPMKILVPPKNVIDRFDAFVRPLFDEIAFLERESYTLAALRDTLLPKLISGQLRVPDAERFLQEHGL